MRVTLSTRACGAVSASFAHSITLATPAFCAITAVHAMSDHPPK